MAGIIYADYELVERAGETETMAVFKGQHVLIVERLRAVKMAQGESARVKPTFRPERLKEVFGTVCKAAALTAAALDAAGPGERVLAERIAFVETIHFDAAEKPDGEKPDYILAEWVGGGSLADKLCTGPMALTQTMEIVVGVLQGLEFAHAHNLRHGSLKPTNILLTRDGQPKIADFGSNILGDGMPPRLGSLAYLSPEQMEAGHEPDGRADLFSLTLILYEMLTGRRAPRLLTAAQMPSRINAQVCPALDDLIVRGLQTDPALRFASAREMQEQLRAAQENPNGAGLTIPTFLPAMPAVSTAKTGMVETEAIAAPVLPPSTPVVPSGAPATPPATTVVVTEPVPPCPEPAVVLVAPTIARRVGERKVNDVDGAEMVWVPAGLLAMGSTLSETEQPIANVAVEGFWVYRYPITQAQYLKYMQHLRTTKGVDVVRPTLFKRGDDHLNKAAAGIKWSEAGEYAAWAGGRLPTEVEWEWAARGPEALLYPWGATWNPACANVSESGIHEQSEVDRYSMSESWCGAVDLLGNVFEWCSSLFKPYPYDANDGREDKTQPGAHTLRGGSATTPADLVRATLRCGPSSQTTWTGFRLVRDAGN